MRFALFILLILPIFLQTALAYPSDHYPDYPESTKERRKSEGFGSILGNDKETGDLQVLGKTIGSSKKSPDKTALSDYFWRAATDIVRSMPIVAIDSKLGLISTDWHETSSDTRYKYNILIEDEKVKVNAFKQVYGNDGWRDLKEGAGRESNKLLNKIMARAKELQYTK